MQKLAAYLNFARIAPEKGKKPASYLIRADSFLGARCRVESDLPRYARESSKRRIVPYGFLRGSSELDLLHKQVVASSTLAPATNFFFPISHSANSANRAFEGPARMNVAQSKSSPLSESTKGRSETNMRKNNLNTLAGGEGESGGSRKRSAFDSDDTAALSLQTGCELTPNGCLPDARISTAVGLTARASI